jgi:type II secretory pathway predicted ATPase ExeA/outer membrane protein OmpA-like peptidoglycan-associated protein
MYESFFELREKPFSLLPDPGFLFMSRQHQQALTLLEYGLMNQAGFIILTGEIGSGKTTLMRHLLSRLDASFSVGLISNTHQSLGELMDWVCMAFDLPGDNESKLEKYQRFINFLIETYGKGNRVLLIVDEAQNLGVEKLEELRLLSNINAGKDLVLQLMLLGQPQLRDLLRQPELEQFAQRVTASYHIGPLDPTETENYIRHRIFIAGGTQEIFTHDACLAVHHYSKGVPRLINLICDTALVYAYGADQKLLNGTAIDEFVASHTPNLMISVDLEREGRIPAFAPESKNDLSGLGAASSTGETPHQATSPPEPRSPAFATIAGSTAITPAAHPGDHDKSEELGHPTAPSRKTPTPSSPVRPPHSARSPETSEGQRLSQSDPTRGNPTTSGSGDMEIFVPPIRVTSGRRLGESTSRSRLASTSRSDQSELLAPLEGSRSPIKDDLGLASSSPPAESPRERSRTRATWLSIAGAVFILSALGLALNWLSTPGTGADSGTGFPKFLDPIRNRIVDTRDRVVDSDEVIPLAIRPHGDSSESLEPADAGSVTEQMTAAIPESSSGSRASQSTPVPEIAPETPAPPGAALDLSASDGAEETIPETPIDDAAVTDNASAQATQDATGRTTIPLFGRLPRPPAAESPDPAEQTLPGAIPGDIAPGSDDQQLLMTDIQQQLLNLSYSVERLGPNRVIADLGPLVQFDDGSADLQPNAKALLARIAGILQEHEGIRIRVIAHTDSSGTDALNQAISDRRARTVASYLQSLDIPDQRMASEGRGKSELRVDPEDERLLGPWINRRIELELSLTDIAAPNAEP